MGRKGKILRGFMKNKTLPPFLQKIKSYSGI
jgi:hypothetical protein